MKKHSWTLWLCALLILSACQSESTSQQSTSSEAEATEENSAVQKVVLKKDPRNIGGAKSAEQLTIERAMKKIEAAENRLVGYWVGSFGKNRINIAITDINGSEVQGHSVCAGNFRPLTGTVSEVGPATFAFELKEPGDDRYDGIFAATIDLNQKRMQGAWTPYQSQGNSPKTYELAKQKFVYQPGVGEFPEGSTRILTEKDVENRMAEELEIMRNEIYARHGYSFKNKDMRYYFEGKDWYVPMGVDIRSQLTEVEAQNIDLIYEYESYLDEYYDDFGR